MRFGRCRGVLLALGFVLLCPAVASADALDGAFMVLEVLAAIWGLVLLLMLVSVLAYLRPASQPRRVLNLVGIGISILLGAAGLLITSKMGAAGSLARLGTVNPFVSLTLPLAAWLGGASHAASATQPRARQWGVAVAVAGGQLLAGTLLNLAVGGLLLASLGVGSASYPYVQWVLGLLVSVRVWWLVLGQAQRRQPLGWQQLPIIMRVAALATLVSVAYSYLPFLIYVGDLNGEWLGQVAGQWFGQILSSLLTYGLLGWVVSVLAIWLHQRRYGAGAQP